jgi:hypothetical protein
MRCPACSRLVNISVHRLNDGLAWWLYQLVSFWRLDDRWYDYKELRDRGGAGATSYALLKWWGFIESSGDREEDGRSSGLWKPTQAGCDFVDGLTRAPEYVLVFNNTLYGNSSAKIDVYQALHTRFRWDLTVFGEVRERDPLFIG